MNDGQTQLIREGISGAVIAPLEVYISGQPLTIAKTTIQQNPGLDRRGLMASMPRTLSGWYRGSVPHATLFTTATAIQYVSYEAMRQQQRSPISCALFAGFATAIVASPMELFLISQNALKLPLQATIKRTWKNLFRGYLHAAARDTVFVAGYKASAPALSEVFQERYSLSVDSASILAGITSGIAAGTLSQPLDTFSTVLKGALHDKTLPSSAREYLKRYGLRSTYSGGALRFLGRVPLAVLIFSWWDSKKG